MLRFRVGIADETLLQHGVTHLVEHLTLSALPRDGSVDFNGYTTLNTTTFAAGGERAAVRSFVARVCDALQSLPIERLPDEISVLKTEAAQRPPNMVEKALLRRFGATGYGLSWFEELGFDRLTPEDVQAHVATYFNADNAVLVLSGSPQGFRAELPRGEAHPVPEVEPVAEPGWMWSGDDRTIGLSWLTERSPAAGAFGRCLERRLTERVRHDKALAYGVSYGSERTGSLSHNMLACPVLPEAAQETVDETQALLQQLADQPVTRQELTSDRKQMMRFAEGAGPAVGGWLDRAADEWLYNRTITQPAEVVAATQRVTPADVTAIAEQALASKFLLIPSETTAGDLPEAKVPGGTPIEAPVHSARSKLSGTDEQRLAVGTDGMTWDGFGESSTYRWTDLAAWAYYENDYRVYIATDGRTLTIEPETWKAHARLLGVLDQYAPRDRRVDFGKWESAPSTAPSGRNPLSTGVNVVLGVFAALFLVTTFSFIGDFAKTPSGDLAANVLVSLVITAAFGVAPGRAALAYWRRRRG